jgi:protoporphyrinogen oxidase
MYVEVSYLADNPINWHKPSFLEQIRNDLIAANILKNSDKILVANFIPIHYAYVIYTLEYKTTVKTIFSFLRDQNIFCVGRYGEWKYSYMEEAILDGRKTAATITHLNC